MHALPLPQSKSKSLFLILSASKSISLHMSPRILISGEIYSIKINKYLSVYACMRAALWANAWLLALPGKGREGRVLENASQESHLLWHPW